MELQRCLQQSWAQHNPRDDQFHVSIQKCTKQGHSLRSSESVKASQLGCKDFANRLLLTLLAGVSDLR